LLETTLFLEAFTYIIMKIFRVFALSLVSLQSEFVNGFQLHTGRASSLQTRSIQPVGDNSMTSLAAEKRELNWPSLPVQLMLAATLLTVNPVSSNAYSTSDYASDAVVEALGSIKSAKGDKAKSFAAFEEVAKIITEGKGVGGNVNYAGVTLERGEVADEDTSIYNPGLTLLTESEKTKLVEAIVDSKQKGIKMKAWDQNNEYAFEFLKTNLDPLHVYELRPYLSIFPFYSAGVYLLTLFVQQTFRSLFETAYIVGVIAVFAPAILLIATGP